MRCMDNTQRKGAYSGTYVDDKNEKYKWSCPIPSPFDDIKGARTQNGQRLGWSAVVGVSSILYFEM